MLFTVFLDASLTLQGTVNSHQKFGHFSAAGRIAEYHKTGLGGGVHGH